MQGTAFLGEHLGPPQEYLYGFRGRMDERYDLIRSVRDQRYVYVRNYMPHRIGGQHVAYMFETPTTRVWKKLYDEGQLTPAQRIFWEPRQPEELYDLQTDPDEVKNLAFHEEHRATLRRLRQACRDWILRVRDVGFLPEDEIHSRAKGSTPYTMGHDDQKYPLKRILAAAENAAYAPEEVGIPLADALKDRDSAVRYWGAQGLLIRGKVVLPARTVLTKALADESPYVRIITAELLGRYGSDADLKKALSVLLKEASIKNSGLYVSVFALNSLDYLGARAAGARDAIKALPVAGEDISARMRFYNERLREHIVANLSKGRP
jgi:uncharacterized sulfatase